MRVLLIRHHSVHSDEKGFYPQAKNIYPPLGLVYLATVLKQNDNNALVKILDSKALNLSVSQAKYEIKTFNPDIIGIAALTETLPGAVEMCEICKGLFPDTLRIIGGPHMSVDPEPIMKLGLFQLGIIGEGEITITEVYNEFKNSKRVPTNIKGTIVCNDDKIIRNEFRPRVKDLDTIPIPDRKFLNNDLYGPYLAKKPFTYMTTTRGCPFKCAFCFNSVWGKQVTFNSAQRIFKEMKKCVDEFKIREIWFKDDTYTARRKVVLELCNLIKNEKVKVRWTIFSRVDTVDEEMVKALKDAGCYKIDFGVESGDQRILDLMKKGITIEQVCKAFKICRNAGVQTHAFFMIGYPRETRETIEKSIRFAQEIADWTSFNAVTIIPGTELYDLAVRENYFIPKYVNGFLGQSEMENFCNSKELSTQEILRLTSLAYKKFYLRPGHILRLLGLMIKDGVFLNFIRIIPYVLKRIFGKFQQLKR